MEPNPPCFFTVSSTREENQIPLDPRGASAALKTQLAPAATLHQTTTIMISSSSSFSRNSSPDSTSSSSHKEYKFEPSYELSPGIWSNKTVSSSHPHVQDLLKSARSLCYLHGKYNPVVYALAALELYYKPYEQAHWLFWSTKKMQRTAEIVNSVYFHNPPLIQSKVKWVGIRESLNFLRNYRASRRSSYENAPWYYTHEPQEQPAPKMQLRDRSKRKRIQTYDFLSDAELEDVGALPPPPKRPRVKKASSSKKAVTSKTTQPLKLANPAPAETPATDLTQPVTSAQASSPSPTHSPSLAAPAVLPAASENSMVAEDAQSVLSETDVTNEPARSRARSASQSSNDTAVCVSSSSCSGGAQGSRTRHRSLSTSSSVLTAVASTVDGKSECGDVDQEGDVPVDALNAVGEDSAASAAQPEDEDEEAAAPAVVRRSGRTKKTTTARAKAANAPDPGAKRKRGRPRKNAV